MLLLIRRSLEESSGYVYEDFRVVIAMTEIMSARIILPQAYKLFRQEQPSHKRKGREDAEQG